jgi:hypothetical protein
MNEEKKMDSISMDSISMKSMMTQEEEETPPVMTMAVTTTVSKTSDFKWKLTRLPIHFNAVEVIKFETGRVDETDDDETV